MLVIVTELALFIAYGPGKCSEVFWHSSEDVWEAFSSIMISDTLNLIELKSRKIFFFSEWLRSSIILRFYSS
jgi:hypothetical protein